VRRRCSLSASKTQQTTTAASQARIPGASPADVYEVLTEPEAHRVFRGVKARRTFVFGRRSRRRIRRRRMPLLRPLPPPARVAAHTQTRTNTSAPKNPRAQATVRREVLEDDGRGRRRLRVTQRAGVKLLFLSVSFDTTLEIWEDDRARTIRFRSAHEGGFMCGRPPAGLPPPTACPPACLPAARATAQLPPGPDLQRRLDPLPTPHRSRFDGCWTVEPFSPAAAARRARAPGLAATAGGGWLPSPGAGAGVAGGLALPALPWAWPREDAEALVTLEQALQPKVVPPAVAHGLIRSLCSQALRGLLRDLGAEVARRRALRDGGGDGGAAVGGESGGGSGGGAAAARAACLSGAGAAALGRDLFCHADAPLRLEFRL